MKLQFSLAFLILAAGGILAAAFGVLAPLYWLLVGLAWLCLGVVFLVLNRRRIDWLLVLCFFSIGGFLFSLARQNYTDQLKLNRIFDHQEVVLEGTMIKRPAPAQSGSSFTLLVTPDRGHHPVGKITVYCPQMLDAGWYGRRLQVTGKFKALPVNRVFLPEFFERQRIAGTVSAAGNPGLLSKNGLPGPYLWANHLRELLRGVGDRFLKPGNADLLHGMVFGDKLGNEDEAAQLTNDFRRTGTIHLLSVSGLHIGFAVYFLTLLLGVLKVPKKWRILPLTLGIWLYIMMTGMESPVLRAGLMVLVFMIGELLEINDDNLNRLSLAALLLLLYDPYNLFEVGFQLSFTATLGVVWLYPLLKDYFKVKLKPAFLKPVWDGLMVSIGAQLMVLPILINYFQQISWISPLVNLFLIVPSEIVVVGGLVGEGIGIIFPWLGQVILTIVDWAITVVRLIVHCFGSQSWSASWMPRLPWPWVLGYYLGLLVLLDWLRPNLLTQKRKINYGTVLISALVILNLIVWTGFFYRLQRDYVEVDFLDVGQGDSIFIRTPDGSSALIDGGDLGRGKQRILPFLRENGIERLDLAFGTHGHRDHLGGLAEVLQEVPVNTLYLRSESDNFTVRDFLRKLKKVKLKRKTAYDGMKFKLGGMVDGEVLEVPDFDHENENDRSLVLVIFYGKNKLILTGDLSFEGEKRLEQKYAPLLRGSVLKVGHHGSNFATGGPFLAEVRPKLAVISVGAGNKFGHPGNRTLNRFRSRGVPVYRTDLQGRISLRIYRDKLVVSTEKGGV
jgi:competence protein ComEC